MSEYPKPAGTAPMAVELEEGRDYWFCTCGLSAGQPFCDGSHKATEGGFKSHKFTAAKTGKASLCMCKKTRTPPYCDGSHSG